MPPPPPSKPSGPPRKPAFKLRRSIQPRPTISVLNELAAPDKPQFEYYDVPMVERERRAWQSDIPPEEVGEFECRCQVGDLEFIAEGFTKPEAKAAVAELTVQGLIAAKCELNETDGVGNNEDHCPWGIIASLALHKLYTDWQTQGFTLPQELVNLPTDMYTPSAYLNTGNTNANYTQAEIDKNPLQLLNELANKMKLNLDFELTGEVGTPNDKVFTLSVCIGDKTYSGQGKNKKAARHAAASAAMAEREQWCREELMSQEGDEEEEVEQEHDQEGQEEDTQPPEKKRNMEAAGGEEEEEKGEPEPENKGKLPGSYPGNVQE